MTAQRAHPNLGQVIRARRRALGMSQEALAARVSDLGSEIDQADISRIELGKVDLPRRRRLEHLAVALELSPGELLEASGWVGAGSRSGASPTGLRLTCPGDRRSTCDHGDHHPVADSGHCVTGLGRPGGSAAQGLPGDRPALGSRPGAVP